MSALNNLLERRRKAAQSQPAQAWYNDLLGGTHWVGDKILRAFGQGTLSDTLASVEGDALPDQFRTDEQRKAREAERGAKAKQEEADKQAAEEKQRQEQQRQAEAQKQAQETAARIRADEQHKRAELERLSQEYLSQPPPAVPEPEPTQTARTNRAHRHTKGAQR